MENNRNTIIAVALSFAVLFAWNIFFWQPAAERARKQQLTEAAQNPPKPAQSETGATGSTPAVSSGTPAMSGEPGAPRIFATRASAIAASPRISIESPALQGSINLKGGRIDDVVLRDYSETVDPKSPKVVLLSPSGSPEHGYFAVTGWLTPDQLPVTGDDARWEQEGTGPLTVQHPVTMRYDNGQGLVFRRTISVDDRYMFTVSDEVENQSGQPVALKPWGQVARLSEPKTLGYSVLHEGLIAGLGKDGTKDFTYSAAVKNLEDGKIKDTFTDAGGWAGFTDQYWATVLIPEKKTTFNIELYGNASKQFYASMPAAQAVTLVPGGKSQFETRIFAGAKQVDILKQYQAEFGITRFEYLIDWGWFPFLTKPMLWLMDSLYQARGEFRRRHHADDCRREACLLPAREQVVRVDEQDEEASA